MEMIAANDDHPFRVIAHADRHPVTLADAVAIDSASASASTRAKKSPNDHRSSS